MKKNIMIGGELFELCGSVAPIPVLRNRVEPMEIYKAYVKPSRSKTSVWNSWCNWAMGIIRGGGTVDMEISGHSCHTFSIVARVRLRNGNRCKVYITKDHNRAWCVD